MKKHTSTKGRAHKAAAPKLSDRKSLALIFKLTGGDELSEESRGWLNSHVDELISEAQPIDTHRAFAAAARIAAEWDDAGESYNALAAVVTRAAAGEDAAEVVRELAAGARADARPLDELLARADAIAGDVLNFDADARMRIALAAENSRRGLDPARDERELRELVARAERGESLSDLSGVDAKHAEAARTFLALINANGLPDYCRDGLTTALLELQRASGAGLWRTPEYGPAKAYEYGDWSLEILARVFANPPREMPDLTPAPDLAGHISAVLRHPDTPTSIYDGINEGMSDVSFDDTAPEFLRGFLASRKPEGGAK